MYLLSKFKSITIFCPSSHIIPGNLEYHNLSFPVQCYLVNRKFDEVREGRPEDQNFHYLPGGKRWG